MTSRMIGIFFVGATLCLSGCGSKAINLTEDLEGRRVHDLRVVGSTMVYYWSPAKPISSPNHLVMRDLSSGAETAIESPWQGNKWDFDGKRVVYSRPSPVGGGQPGEIVVYDVGSKTSQTIAAALPHSLALSNEWVVWAQRLETGITAIARGSVFGGEAEWIDPPSETDRWMDELVCIDGDIMAWVRRDLTAREYRLYTSSAAAPFARDTGVVYPHRLNIQLNGGKVAYTAGNEADRAVHVYDLGSGTDTIVAMGDRFLPEPQIGGGVVAWMEDVTDEEFQRLQVGPLDVAGDWRNVYRHDLRTGRTQQLASAVYACFRLRVDEAGNVHAVVQRKMTDRSQTNLVYGVDVWRW